MSEVYDEPIVVRLTQPVGPYPVGTEFGFKDVADAIRALGSSAYFEVVRTQDGDPIPPPTPEDLTEAERQALARARAARLIRGGEFDKLVPGPGEVIVGSEDGPVARDVSEIGGGIKPEDGVFGVGVRRIIASDDPNYPLQDGDLLILLDVPRHFTDFSEYTTGAAPNDWTMPWAQAPFTVESDAGATGGKVLRLINAADQRSALSWGAATADAMGSNDVEIAYKWRVSAGMTGVRSIIRGGGASGSEMGYHAGHIQSSARVVNMLRYNSGAAISLSGMTLTGDTIPTNTWFISRFRIEGETIRYKEWKAADPEPATWMFDYPGPVSYTTPGFVGVAAIGTGTADFDFVSVALDGATALLEGV